MNKKNDPELTLAHETASDRYRGFGLPPSLRTAAIADKFAEILEILGIDHTRDPQTKDTPDRVARMLFEVCSGRYSDPPKLTEFPNEATSEQETYELDELVVVGPIRFNSLCSHHFVPVIGNVYIGYVPDKYLVGLSKFSRVVEYFAKRPQIQEVMTTQIFDFLMDGIKPKHLAVFVDAIHFCMTWRGVKDTASASTNKLSHRIKRNGGLRTELLNIVSDRRKPIF